MYMTDELPEISFVDEKQRKHSDSGIHLHSTVATSAELILLKWRASDEGDFWVR